MLAKYSRLTKEKDFKRINAKGKSFFSSLFRIKMLPNDRDNSRLAVVVSVRVSKKAVARNRLKRQVREVLRLNYGKLKPKMDIIVSVSPLALGKDHGELETSLLNLLAKAKLL